MVKQIVLQNRLTEAVTIKITVSVNNLILRGGPLIEAASVNRSSPIETHTSPVAEKSI